MQTFWKDGLFLEAISALGDGLLAHPPVQLAILLQANLFQMDYASW